MADQRVTELVAVVTAAPTDVFAVRQSGDNRDKKETIQQVLDQVVVGGGLLSGEYKFSTSIVAADPGPGRFRYDNSDPALVTEVFIDDFTDNAVDISNILSLVTTGDRMYFQTADDSSEFLVFNVTAPITDNTGWFTVAGTVEASGTLHSNNDSCVAALQIGGASSLPDPILLSAGLVSAPSYSFSADPDTGVYNESADELAVAAGGVKAVSYAEAGNGVIKANQTNVGLTASVTQTQAGGLALLSSYNEVSVVASGNDTVTLPTAVAGRHCVVINNAALILRIYPALDDDLGNGVDVFTSLIGSVEAAIHFFAFDDTTWVVVGTGVTSGLSDFSSDTPLNNGMLAYDGVADIWKPVAVTFDGSNFVAAGVISTATGLGGISNTLPSATVPALFPRRLDADTGIGRAAEDALSLIAGGFEGLRLTELNSGVIQAPDAEIAITAFAGGGQGSATQLDESYNVIEFAATAGDSVKLPPVFAINSIIFIKNDGPNAIDVFPSSGDNLGLGDDIAISLASGESLSFIATVGNVLWTQLFVNTSGPAVFPEFQFSPLILENPNNADWTVNALAPAVADSNNAGLTVRLFDDTVEEGVGFQFEVPAGATNIVFALKSRAETTPGGAVTVGLDIYNRGIPDNAAVQAWSVATQLTDLDFTTNEFFQEDSQSVTLATLGITAGELTQFELVRVAPSGGSDLTGDWVLANLKVSFT